MNFTEEYNRGTNFVQKNLENDETILWTGAPERYFVFKKHDIFIILLGLIFLSFSLNGALSSIMWHQRGGRDYVGFFTSIPFVFIGLYLVFGIFISRYKRLKNTIYFLTTKRILEYYPFFKNEMLTQLPYSYLKHIHTVKHKNNTADIIFEKKEIDMKKILKNTKEIRDIPQSITFKNIRDYQTAVSIAQNYLHT